MTPACLEPIITLLKPSTNSAIAARAANFNGLNFNYAYVRNKARKLTGT
jgi:hypothetical protein